MRTKIVAGNWKMNKTFEEAKNLIAELIEYLNKRTEAPNEVVICPPSVYLELASDLSYESDLFIGAQNVSEHASGAYTGEISANMLYSLGVDVCIIGHSERRKYFNESHEMLAKKIDICLKNEVAPIFCIGEQLEQREAGHHFEIVKEQIMASTFHLEDVDFSKLIFAYEPVWAIGTGVTASPEQAQEMHAFIRQIIREKYGNDVADVMSILYGGSCNPGNARELFSLPDVDGGLIGGASLKAEDFIKIIESHQ